MPRPAGPPTLAALALALALAPLTTGCAARRHLVVLSDPPGATVRVDNEVVGLTPLDHRFDHFGGRRLTLYLEGHSRESRLVELKAPWYARFPLDLFTELLFPVGYRFVHVESFELEPETTRVTLPDLAETLRRAEQLRRGGLTGPRPEPLPDPPAPPMADPAPPEADPAPPEARSPSSGLRSP